ncbi:hypothetical protein TRIUR3_33767 [Triticum urartu]|uniref:Uncharacterized protein n=1 Tax=Triticum urartu TaxID=4572 RepID=M8ATG4_TRIUA|nr:hypothetical protein TRIUR3_33767 [Triticum urartu]
MSSCQMLMGSVRYTPAISTMDVATGTGSLLVPKSLPVHRTTTASLHPAGASQSKACRVWDWSLDTLRLVPASIPSAEPMPLSEDPPSSKGHSRTGRRRKGVTTTQSRPLRRMEHRRCRRMLYRVAMPHQREVITLLVVGPGHCVCVGSV